MRKMVPTIQNQQYKGMEFRDEGESEFAIYWSGSKRREMEKALG